MILSVLLGILIAGGSAVAVVAWLAFARSRLPRLGSLAAGFTSITVGAAAAAALLWMGQPAETAMSIQVGSTAVGILLIYLAAVKR